MQGSLDKYVSQLLSEKGVPETPESHATLLEELNEVIDRALFESLTMDQIEEINRADKEERATDEMMQQMLTESNINPTDVANKALIEFRENYLKGETNE